ncbi:hypothetical protein BHE74_00009390 [Ensete ventricosum]|nr:hypothetical protein BHE74_00009390 [Ensete ventricosum]
MDVPDGDDWVRDTPFGEGVFVSKVLVSCSMKLLLLPLPFIMQITEALRLQLDVQRRLREQLEVRTSLMLQASPNKGLLSMLQLDVQRCLHKQLEVHFMMLLLLVIPLKSSC